MRKSITIDSDRWSLEGEKRYGPDRKKWKFRCPVCGNIASAEDYFSIGAPADAVGFSCIGRWSRSCDRAYKFDATKDSGPCDYSGGGLFRLNPITVVHNGEKTQFFDFEDPIKMEDEVDLSQGEHT